jgi:hypothetical protein
VEAATVAESHEDPAGLLKRDDDVGCLLNDRTSYTSYSLLRELLSTREGTRRCSPVYRKQFASRVLKCGWPKIGCSSTLITA